MRKNSRGELSGAVRDETLAEVQQQEEEVSSRDKSAISPGRYAVPCEGGEPTALLKKPHNIILIGAEVLTFTSLPRLWEVRTRIFIRGLVSQLSQASTRFNDGEGLNFMLSVIKSIHPRDCIEAMLGAQMAAVHMSTMNYVDEFARLWKHTPTGNGRAGPMEQTLTNICDASGRFETIPDRR